MPANYDVEISKKLNTCWDQYINVRTTGCTGCIGNFKNICNNCKTLILQTGQQYIVEINILGEVF